MSVPKKNKTPPPRTRTRNQTGRKGKDRFRQWKRKRKQMKRADIHGAGRDQDPLQCVLRLPLPNAGAAHIMMQVLRVEPPVPGTSKEVQLWADDCTRSTVHVTMNATRERLLRAAVGALLEQTKLILRTMDAFPAIARHMA